MLPLTRLSGSIVVGGCEAEYKVDVGGIDRLPSVRVWFAPLRQALALINGHELEDVQQ
jgi:hypothetical protein